MWLWHPAIGVPAVVHAYHQPGWLLDLHKLHLGIVCGHPHDRDNLAAISEPRYRATHWPACAGDQIDIRWMPLANVQLTDEGFYPGGDFLAMLERQPYASRPRRRGCGLAFQTAIRALGRYRSCCL